MPTVKTILDPKATLKDGSKQIVIRVIDGAKQKTIGTGYKVLPVFFDNGRVTKKHPDHVEINAAIELKERAAKDYVSKALINGKRLVLSEMGNDSSGSFTGYLRGRKSQYKEAGKFIHVKRIDRLITELNAVRREVLFTEVDAGFLRDYESYLIKEGNANNTRLNKFKLLRQLFSNAIDEGKAAGSNPFKKYKIVKKPVKKEKLSEPEILKLESLQLKGIADNVRDLFLFSYYCYGARFENCIFLKRSQVTADRINFKTNKGEKFLSVNIHDRLKKLLSKYDGDLYVFPFLKNEPASKEVFSKRKDELNVIVNRWLAKVIALAEIKKKVTFHCARHSFANAMKSKNTSIHAIKEALGHSDYKTTQIYLASFADEILDAEAKKLYGE